jgi:Ni/Fe-hydrogenase subunit HybB-like protein
MVPIVIFGVVLSVLHQSSLGACFLIAPTKLSPLWYDSLLPYQFLVSAVLMGLSMVSFETILSEKAFGHKADRGILSGLARGSLITAAFYLVFKLFCLLRGPGLGAAFDGSFAANLYLIEMLLSAILPIVLFASPTVRRSPRRIFAVNLVVILGVLLNRLNVGIFGIAPYTSRLGADYFPSFAEFAVTGAMVAFAILGFKLCVKHLNLFAEARH